MTVGYAGQNGWLSLRPMQQDEYVGFVYIIVNEITEKLYVGYKQYKGLGKKTVKRNGKTIPNPRYKKYSDWKNYYGSSKKLQDDIKKYNKENFTRIMISEWTTKRDLKNAEANLQHKLDVLTQEHPKINGEYLFYNEFIDKCYRPRRKEIK